MGKELGISKIYKTSVKEDFNVTSVFTHLAQIYVQSVISLNAEDDQDEEYLLPLQDEDGHQHNNISYPLFGNNNKNKNSKKLLNGSNNQHNNQIANSNGNNKGIFKSPVILKSTGGGGINHGSNLQNHQQRGFFSSAKNKILHSHNHNNQQQQQQNRNHVNLQNNNPVRKNNQANGNGGLPSYTFGNGNNSHGPRWNDTGKYDNMPFRLDLVKAKKKRRELCSIL